MVSLLGPRSPCGGHFKMGPDHVQWGCKFIIFLPQVIEVETFIQISVDHNKLGCMCRAPSSCIALVNSH